MEQPPEPKRRRSQRLQQAAAAEAGASRGPAPAPEPATPAPAVAEPPPCPDASGSAAAGGSSTCCPFARILLPDLLQRIAGFMERNEVACSLRLVCTAAAGALKGPGFATVRLSEVSPPAAFALQWSRLDALYSLTREQRSQLELLTARSGSVANLQTLVARGDLPLLSLGPGEWGSLLEAAARHGHMELCNWLRQQGAAITLESFKSAAASGNLALMQSLADTVPDAIPYADVPCAACAAAREGHVHVLNWLLDRMQLIGCTAGAIFWDAAHGCTLGALQQLLARFPVLRQGPFEGWLASAAGSPTPDWRQKVEWLEAVGCPRSSSACCTAAAQPDAVVRLQWLVARGYALHPFAACFAAGAGNTEALQYLAERGVQLDDDCMRRSMRDAVEGGHLSAVQVLHNVFGVGITPEDVACAVQHGHLPLVAWAAEQLGAGLELTADLFRSAARSDSWPLMHWLHERRCPWDATVFAAAAYDCSEEQLEWLVERGCPMGDGTAAFAAAADDMWTLRCLRRVGCPFAPDGGTFTAVVKEQMSWRPEYRAHLLEACSLLVLLDAGCPVDWAAAVNAAKGDAALESWLREQQQQRGAGAGRLRPTRRPAAR